MSLSNLSKQEKESLICIIEYIKDGKIDEEFYAYGSEQIWLRTPRIDKSVKFTASSSALYTLEKKGLIIFKGESKDFSRGRQRKYQLNSRAYQVVENNFAQPDILLLGNTINLDKELKQRCLPILATNNNDSTLWDSALRTAGVILEERLRQKAEITDTNTIGRCLVNKIFNEKGVFADKFTTSSEREGYRELYAGIMGVFRNPSAHKLIDPTPEDGGAYIMFINLLLKKLDNL